MPASHIMISLLLLPFFLSLPVPLFMMIIMMMMMMMMMMIYMMIHSIFSWLLGFPSCYPTLPAEINDLHPSIHPVHSYTGCAAYCCMPCLTARFYDQFVSPGSYKMMMCILIGVALTYNIASIVGKNTSFPTAAGTVGVV
jgi:hypothetical protein